MFIILSKKSGYYNKTVFLFTLLLISLSLVSHSDAEDLWLDDVILFDRPTGSSSEGGQATAALGAEDGAYVSIDIPETLILAFTDNIAIDGPGDDLIIFEVANGDSNVDIWASEENLTYTYLGRANGSVSFDLQNYPDLSYVKYLKFIGLDNGGTSSGYDLDAVEAPIGNRLAAYYPFNGNANDESENGNHGIVYGATLTTDRFGNYAAAYSFDGVDDKINIPAGIIRGLALTVNLWVKTNDNNYALLSGANSTYDNEYLLFAGSDYNSKLAIHYHDARYITNIETNDDLWHMITVISKIDETKIYVDGMLRETASFGSGPAFNVDGLWIGTEQDCVNGCWNSSQQFNGIIDDIHIYNRAISDTEIQELYGTYYPLDHFTLTNNNGDPIGSQSIGVPFQVTITAKDIHGEIFNFNGGASLSSNAGKIYPKEINLINGIWTGDVRLYEAGTGISLGASGGGRSGESNVFDVSGQGYLGSIAGTVFDNRGTPLSGADVYLDRNNDGTPEYTGLSNSNGFYQIPNIQPGDYFINAEYEGGLSTSDKYQRFISASCHAENLIIKRYDSDKTPVIFVPGIMGSSIHDRWYPELPRDSADTSNIVLHDAVGWSALKEQLKPPNNCYEEKVTIIDCPYDWRMPVNDIVENYLIPCIDKAKYETDSDKVNIVAHSTGGLVVRSYIQGDSYINRSDIDKLAMVGVPNLGAVNAYYIWAGGDPKWVDDLNDSGVVNSLKNVYSNVIETMYEVTYDLGSLYNWQHKRIKNFVQDKTKELKDLLPTFDFLEYQGSVTGVSVENNRNDTLIDLNNNPNRYFLMSPTGGPDVVKTRVFISYSENTIGWHSVLYPESNPERAFYEDGEPNHKKDPYKKPGDETVLVESASLPYSEGWASIADVRSGIHSKLIGVYADLIKDFIDEGESSCSLPLTNQAHLSAISDVANVVSLSIHGRVQPYIINPDGLESGVNYSLGTLENNIPEASIDINVDIGTISIENPINGTYTGYLTGSYDEDYSLNIEYGENDTIVDRTYRGFSHSNTTSFTFTLDSSSPDKITINHTPFPPTGLQANAIDSGGLQTQLTWDTLIDPEVIGFNIYSREYDEPYLHHIGTAEITSYYTGHSWAENSLIKTRLYAVSAVKSDGTESFLSDMVENNDRDHDGLTDEEEVSYGTDINDADSDNDGLSDSEEYVKGTDPWLSDTDGDVLSDFDENQNGTDPLNQDTDGDGIDDPNDVCPVDKPVRISDIPPVYYSSLQTAVTAALDKDTLQMHDKTFTEDLSFNSNISITLESGYDCSYTINTGTTTVNGNMTIIDGVLTIQSGTLGIQQ